MGNEEIIILSFAIVFTIGINVLIYKHILKKALRKHIQPFWDVRGYKIEYCKFAGILSTGDFKRKGFPFWPFLSNGYPIHSTYVYLFIKQHNNSKPPALSDLQSESLIIRIYNPLLG